MINILSKLLIAHLVGDFILFRSRLKEKGKPLWKSNRLILHSVTHFILALVAIWDINHWTFALVIGLSHYVGEVLVRMFLPKRPQWAFIIDQLLHVVTIAVIAAIIDTPSFSLTISWIFVAGLIAVTFPAAKFIEVFLSQWPPAKSANKIKGLVNAGLWIGILERVLIYIFITMGHWEGIGFLLAAKSVFRFGDLTNYKDISLTEYIMVGTLLSFCLAVVAGLITNSFTA
jgi:hypothetical protein